MSTNERDVAALVALGFVRDRAVHALQLNGTVDSAADWLFMHPDEDGPPEASSSAAVVEHNDDEAVAMVVSFGFSLRAARQVLKANGGDVERAIETLIERSESKSQSNPVSPKSKSQYQKFQKSKAASPVASSDIVISGVEDSAAPTTIHYGDFINLVFRQSEWKGKSPKVDFSGRFLNADQSHAQLSLQFSPSCTFQILHPDSSLKRSNSGANAQQRPVDPTAPLLLRCAPAGHSLHSDHEDACFIATEADNSVSCMRRGPADLFMKFNIRCSNKIVNDGDVCQIVSQLGALGADVNGAVTVRSASEKAVTSWILRRAAAPPVDAMSSSSISILHTPARLSMDSAVLKRSPALAPSSGLNLSPRLNLDMGRSRQNSFHEHTSTMVGAPVSRDGSSVEIARRMWSKLRTNFRLSALRIVRVQCEAARAQFAHDLRVIQTTAQTNADKVECVSCWDSEPNTVLLECGHICLCASCAPAAKTCPLCRKDVSRFVVQRKC